MSRGFDGLEIDDFQNPERDVSHGPESNSRAGWDAVRRLERIHGEEERADQRDQESRRTSGGNRPASTSRGAGPARPRSNQPHELCAPQPDTANCATQHVYRCELVNLKVNALSLTTPASARVFSSADTGFRATPLRRRTMHVLSALFFSPVAP